VSPYLAYHPGGQAILLKCLGKDATQLYDKYHSWVNLDALIGKLQIGYLDTSSSGEDDDDSENDGDEDTAKLSLPEHLGLSRR
jgi:cytochrome b involved in lipid metabolism